MVRADAGMRNRQARIQPERGLQQMQLQSLQQKIASHLKIKNLNLAEVEFIDLLRKVTQTIQKPLVDRPAAAGAGAAGAGASRIA